MHTTHCLIIGCKRAWAAEVKGKDRLVRWRARKMQAPDIDEVAQRVWEVALTHRSALSGRENTSSWLMAITRNAVWSEINYIRQRQINSSRPWVSTLEPLQEHTIEEQEAVEVARRLLSGCTPSERRAMVAVHYEGLSPVKAAERLGVSVNTVKTNLQLAKKRMLRAAAIEAAHILPARLQAITCWPETAPETRAETHRRCKRRRQRGVAWRKQKSLVIRRGASHGEPAAAYGEVTMKRPGQAPQVVLPGSSIST